MRRYVWLLVAMAASVPAWGAGFSDGVSDDRVRLPGGPGSLQGVGDDVSINPNMGVMEQSIPFDLPAGFPGATPSLGLSYSSSNGSSEVGVGWSLDLPSVERMTARGLPNYTTNDAFVVDGGDELVRVDQTSDSAIYRNRFESGFVRWVWHISGSQDYWEAQYPDGRRGFFGADSTGNPVASARVAGAGGTFRYHLVETVDVFGHRVLYTYTKTAGGYALLSKIQWLFYDDKNNLSRYSVQLSYETRSDVSSDATPGVEVRLDQRLTKVDVYYNGPAATERVRGYQLSYSPTAWLSQLVKVQSFGLGDPNNQSPYPIVHTFDYSQALGASSGLSLVQVAGKLTGAQISSGSTTLLDINGDGLPDVIDSSNPGPHQIWLAQLNSDGTESFVGPTASKVATQASFNLSDSSVTPLDVNGDGFTDLVSAKTQKALLNNGSGDWGSEISLGAGLQQWSTGFDPSLRYFDYDDDKRIDILASTSSGTTVYRNMGDGSFQSAQVDSLGVDFTTLTPQALQMADMNGDGLLDIVQIFYAGSSSQLEYKLNLGNGHWSANWTTVQFPNLSSTEITQAKLEDLNGDALTDLVVIEDGAVKYSLNRNGQSFDAVQTISMAGSSSLPTGVGSTVTGLIADMNGNGSQDIVWIDNATGQVTYLELFAIRPNLLTHIENGIGAVTDVAYASTVIEEAKSREAGTPWKYKLPFHMTVVDHVDSWDRLTNLHEVTQYSYLDGYYDGTERQYRGHAHVEMHLVGDDSMEDGQVINDFETGVNDVYLHGTLTHEATYSGGRLLSDSTHQYQKCPVELEVQSPQLTYPIYFACEVKEQTSIYEGTTTPIVTEVDTAYDGFGNVTKESNLGVVTGCNASCTRPSDAFGEACGDGCLGDESFSETQYVPRSMTGGAWIIHAPSRAISYGKSGGATTETIVYYDGAPFVGVAGQLSKGLVSRVTVKANDTDAPIAATQTAYDVNGMVTDTLDPNGSPGNTSSHRRHYTYDADGVRPITVDVFNQDASGNPYELERRVRYDERFNEVVWATGYMMLDGKTTTGENATSIDYDSFGRQIAVHATDPKTALPSDQPTTWFTYNLKSPASSIGTYTTLNGESVRCMDGRGRTYQQKTRISDGRYLVNGFAIYNKRGEVVQSFEPYSSTTDDCDAAPPSTAKSIRNKYDAEHRLIATTPPDDGIYQTPSLVTTQYLPLQMLEFDQLDNDMTSPFANTPTVRRFNGLGQLVAIGRTMTAGQPPSMLTVTYDELGRMQGYVDAAGNRKTQTYDLAGRLLQLQDPNAGLTAFTYDAAGNVLSQTDARNQTVRFEYDGLNRLIHRYEDGNHDATLVTALYDRDPDCANCSNTPGRLAGIVYPDGKDNAGFDVRGRAIWSGRTLEGFTFETTSQYDDRDRLVSLTQPDGRTLGYSYDDGGRLLTIGGVVSSIAYDDRGLRSETDFANNTKETRSYDDLMRLVDLSLVAPSGPAQALHYQRDRVGNVLSVADLSQDPTKSQLGAQYGYDAWYRTTSVAFGNETLTYQFDNLDNIVSATSTVATSSANLGSYAYDPARPNAVSKAGSLSLQYDAAGHVTQRNDRTLSWDALGRLTSSTLGDDTATYKFGPAQDRAISIEPHGVTHHISHSFEAQDGLGVTYVRLGMQRVARLVSPDFAAKVYSDVAPLGAPDGKITAGDAWISHAAQNNILSLSSTPSPEDRLLLSSARRILYETLPQTTYFASDQLDSITLETDDQGAVIGRRAYSTFGNTRLDSGDDDRYGFTSQETDDTGLIHFSYRQLDSTLGRWTATDPMFAVASPETVEGLGESTVAFAYVANNNANDVDPTGLGRKKRNGSAKKHTKVATPQQKNPYKKLPKGMTVNRLDSNGVFHMLIVDSRLEKNYARKKGFSQTMKTHALMAQQEHFDALVSAINTNGSVQPVPTGGMTRNPKAYFEKKYPTVDLGKVKNQTGELLKATNDPGIRDSQNEQWAGQVDELLGLNFGGTLTGDNQMLVEGSINSSLGQNNLSSGDVILNVVRKELKNSTELKNYLEGNSLIEQK